MTFTFPYNQEELSADVNVLILISHQITALLQHD